VGHAGKDDDGATMTTRFALISIIVCGCIRPAIAQRDYRSFNAQRGVLTGVHVSYNFTLVVSSP
jgi:hypothetical protein